MATKRGAFTLVVPLDFSQLAKGAEDQDLKVVAQTVDGGLTSAAVRRQGDKGSAQLGFSEHPGPLRILAGPERATDVDLTHSQTIAVDVPGGSWAERGEVALEPIV